MEQQTRDDSGKRSPSLQDLLAASRDWTLAPELALADLDAIPGVTRLQVQLLHNRGVSGVERVRSFLAATPDAPGDPLPGLPAALERMRRALAARERVVVYGDFDVDGITSCAVMTLALRALGADVHPYVSGRADAGRGPNNDAIQALADAGATLIVTTDCGTTNKSEVAFARTLGVDVIVTDHHAPHGPLADEAVTIVNPHVATGPTDALELAGVGVAYRVAQALLGPTRAETTDALLDLVALGTIADLVPLVGANRALARAGLARLNTAPRPGLRALARVANVRLGAVGERDIGFRLAPRLNAGSRMGEPQLPLELLLAEDAEEATRLATRLQALNQQRQQVTERMVAEARRQAQERRARGEDDSFILAVGDGWELGILGLVAGRLADDYHLPAFVLSRQDEEYRGSARGPESTDLIAALGQVSQLFSHFGGHARAAGFTLPVSSLDTLLLHLQTHLAAPAAANVDLPLRAAPIVVDCRLPLSRATVATYEGVRALAPYGPGFAEPVFVCQGVQIARCWATGYDQRHLRLALREGNTSYGAFWPDMGHLADAINRALPAAPDVDVAYTLDASDAGPNLPPQVRLRVASMRVASMRVASTHKAAQVGAVRSA